MSEKVKQYYIYCYKKLSIFLNRFRTASIKVIDCSQKVSVVNLFVYARTEFLKLIPKMQNLQLIANTRIAIIRKIGCSNQKVLWSYL
jgi:hypothetical protein